MQGALGRSHGVRQPFDERVYYYAAPIVDEASEVTGVIVVAVNIAAIEWDWVGGNPAVFFTDALRWCLYFKPIGLWCSGTALSGRQA